MNEETFVAASTVYTLVPLAALYGGYHLWRLRFGKEPTRLCNTFRYLLGYWAGSALYILMCILFPLGLAISVLVVYFAPEWIIGN